MKGKDGYGTIRPAPLVRTFADKGGLPQRNHDPHTDNSSGYREAEERKEAASTQVVERGHKVTLVEVPDNEDDTSYQTSLAWANA